MSEPVCGILRQYYTLIQFAKSYRQYMTTLPSYRLDFTPAYVVCQMSLLNFQVVSNSSEYTMYRVVLTMSYGAHGVCMRWSRQSRQRRYNNILATMMGTGNRCLGN